MFGSNVQPRRIIKPKPAPWQCRCPVWHPANTTRCPDCGRRRH